MDGWEGLCLCVCVCAVGFYVCTWACFCTYMACLCFAALVFLPYVRAGISAALCFVFMCAFFFAGVCKFLYLTLCVCVCENEWECVWHREDQGQCQAQCQTCVHLFGPRPGPRLLQWANEHKQKTEEKERGRYCMGVCMCVYICDKRVKGGKYEDRRKKKLGPIKEQTKTGRTRQGEYEKTTTWFHPVLSHALLAKTCPCNW